MTDDPPAPRPTDPYRRQPPTIDLAPSGGTPPRPGAAPKAPASPAPGGSPAAGAGKAPVGAVPPPSSQTARQAAPAAGPAAPRGAIPKTGPSVAPGVLKPVEAKTADAKPAEAKAASSGPADTRPEPPVATPAAAAAAAAAAAPRRSAGGLLAAGLTGGLVGAAFAIGADLYWRQPPADFESRLAALETRPGPAQAGAAPAALSALDGRVAALEARTRTLADGLEAARTAPAAAPAPAPTAAATPAAPVAAPDPALREAVTALDGRVARIEGQVGGAATQDSVNALGSRLQEFQAGAEERARANAAAIGTLQGTAGSLADRLAADAKAIEALRADLGRLPPALLTPALRAVASAQAGAALDGGAPLAPAIAALERLGVPADALAPLRPYAEAAAPTPAALLAEFRPIGDRLTALPQGASDSFTDRLKRIAEKVVTVRAVGDGTGDDLPGLVGRIEAALGRDAPAEAAAAWDRLPEASRRESAEWGARLKARVAAQDALRRLNADSLAALAAPAR